MPIPVTWKELSSKLTRQAGNDTTLPSGSVDASTVYKLKMVAFQEQRKQLQNTVSDLKKQAEALKGKKDKASQQNLARVNAQLSSANAKLSSINGRLTDVQNKYYESSGQYEKLLTGANRDAFMALESVFKQYGLESLAGKIYDYVKNGYSSDTISILLQDTKEYKQRFAANDARVKAGLPVLSPADYINTENAYRQMMRQSGLPQGFYDNNDDFTEFIAKDVSPTELQSRVDLATQATALANPYYKQALNQIGIGDGELAAYFLDPDRALPLLQKSAASAAIGAAALQQGLAFNQSYAEQLATSGVTSAQAQQGYSQVAQELDTMRSLGSIYGPGWTQSESEQSVFGTSQQASAKKAGLVAQERGQFNAAAGGARAGLSQSKAQG